MALSITTRFVAGSVGILLWISVGSRAADPIPAPDGPVIRPPVTGVDHDAKVIAKTIVHLPASAFSDADRDSAPRPPQSPREIPLPTLFAAPAQITIARAIPDSFLAPIGLTPENAPIGRVRNTDGAILYVGGTGGNVRPATGPVTTRNLPASNS
jgi:hypothetical protein